MIRHATTILIVDDSSTYCEQLKQWCATFGSLHVNHVSNCYSDALATIEEVEPDLLIVEIGIRHGNGMEFVRKVGLRHPHLRILVCTHQDELLYAERALRVGAHGYLMKSDNEAQFTKALKKVLQGELYVSPLIEEKILRAIAGQADYDEQDPQKVLSNRELEIFVKIGEGLSSREIAEELSLSVKTVETHRAHIKRKLNIVAARELMSRAGKWASQSPLVHA